MSQIDKLKPDSSTNNLSNMPVSLIEGFCPGNLVPQLEGKFLGSLTKWGFWLQMCQVIQERYTQVSGEVYY